MEKNPQTSYARLLPYMYAWTYLEAYLQGMVDQFDPDEKIDRTDVLVGLHEARGILKRAKEAAEATTHRRDTQMGKGR